MCPSSGRNHSSAEGQRSESHSPCEAGTTRSRPPWRKRAGATMSAGSKPHAPTPARSSSMNPPMPPARAGRTTSITQDHSPARAASSSGVNSGSSSDWAKYFSSAARPDAAAGTPHPRHPPDPKGGGGGGGGGARRPHTPVGGGGRPAVAGAVVRHPAD